MQYLDRYVARVVCVVCAVCNLYRCMMWFLVHVVCGVYDMWSEVYVVCSISIYGVWRYMHSSLV